MMNADSHASSAESIAQALEYELETLTQVVETLDIEHEALMGSNAERLEQAVAQSSAPLRRMLRRDTSEKNLGSKWDFAHK